MPIPTISLLQVQAKWAYSEIDDGTLSHKWMAITELLRSGNSHPAMQ
jgi:hypothetical protein